ncbi:MAG TPA: histidinol dehydrogenase [Planctomycetota bacterium]|jgi:histidinol dehydrogenase|nr:histidinol dehydrogenase [Planctomycetota bacterium]OQC22237.1 MAG: Histidinol dehydrogenase [Planctomycetes bacterium ADurb.Bin069]HNS00596.1 histidinol dehydrogenase [Planctomycetota bacterium]HNU25928.1 histidinol dehydrogenase [Planctomycetota bacterium]HOE29312.1 histidinol dehydrogenase [Planctomycetota bacterium]
MDDEREREVAAILAAVRREGDAAVRRYTLRFDGVRIAGLRVERDVLARAEAALPPAVRAAMHGAAERIRRFHEEARPRDGFFTGPDGELLGRRWTALDSVGIYAPGGRAAYPSTVLMAAIPAGVAGVPRIAVASPPGAEGAAPLVCAACAIAGIDELYQVGGVQAIGAFAYGTESIPAVDKIVGPGNAYVTCAKKLLYGTVGIDFLAGPSEVVVIFDATAAPEAVAAELLAQAEHDPEARVFCFAACGASLAEVQAAAVRLGEGLPPHVAQVLAKPGTFRSFPDVAAAVEASDAVAPEHLALKVRDPRAALARVRRAGAVMLGATTPVCFGDYFAGPSHVLPTGGTARFSSGLDTADFMRCTHVVQTPAAYARRWGRAVAAFARAEGLEAHARSAERAAEAAP